jgi:hypothetical protein
MKNTLWIEQSNYIAEKSFSMEHTMRALLETISLDHKIQSYIQYLHGFVQYIEYFSQWLIELEQFVEQVIALPDLPDLVPHDRYDLLGIDAVIQSLKITTHPVILTRLGQELLSYLHPEQVFLWTTSDKARYF